MGSNDIPPPHVYSNAVPVANLLLQCGGSLWSITYILLALQSHRSKSYGIPLIALPCNLAWEIVYALYIAEQHLEQFAFASWLCMNVFVVYGFLKYGKNEWKNSTWVGRNLGLSLTIMTAWWVWAHWAFAKWWLDSGVSQKPGKWHQGVEGPDTTELGFWSASIPQLITSVSSLSQLLTRQHTGGLSWTIWCTRSLGTAVGFTGYYLWMWYIWREAHEYVMSPVGILFWATQSIVDLVYPFIFANVRKTERILDDGRRVAGVSDVGIHLKKT